VDLQTVRPLSKSSRVIAVNAFYDWSEYGGLTPGASKGGNRFNLAYIDQLADGKVGVAFGLSHRSKSDDGKQFQAWGSSYPTETGGAFVLGGTKSYVRTSDLDRDSIMGVIEYKPNEDVHSTVDIFLSDFEEKQRLRGMEIPLFWSTAALQPGYTVTDGLVTTSTFTRVQPVIRNDIFHRTPSRYRSDGISNSPSNPPGPSRSTPGTRA
jgi:iron complex outermembrane receptor protein